MALQERNQPTKGPTTMENIESASGMPLEGACNEMRAGALAIEKRARELVTGKYVTGEAAAQAMLAVRHFEDARMRLGKVIQHAVGGGVSCFDSGRPTADDGR